MPESPIIREVRELTAALEAIDRKLTMVDEKVDTKVETHELKRRLHRNFWRTLLVTVTIVALAVGVNRVTLLQSRDDFSEAVTTCFLRPQAISDAQAAACDRQFSASGDHTYQRLQEQSRQATARFLDLQRWAREHGWEPPR